MIVIYIETSGIDSNRHSIVSIGAVDFLHPERRFYEECRVWEGALISEEASVITGYTEEQITDVRKQKDEELLKKFIAWAEEGDSHTLMGHNPAFDIGFLDETAKRYHIELPFPHRSLDLHSICFAHMVNKGITPPVHNKRTDLNSEKVAEYVGIPIEPKPHVAINGAIYEAEAFSRLLYNKKLLPEFENYPIKFKK